MKTKLTLTLTLIRFTAACLALALLGGAALPALAYPRTVTSTKDDGSAGTLREQIRISGDTDTITFTVTGTIVLTNTSGGTTSGELLVGQGLTIIGPGATNLTISGNNSHRVFEFVAGKTSTISGLTISNGRDGADGANASVTCVNNSPVYTSATPGAAGVGAGILNNGTLTVSNCILSGNRAVGGAGGNGNGAPISGCGGGPNPYTYPPGTATSGADGKGGAVFNGGTLNLFGCTLSSNSATGGTGGTGGPSHDSSFLPSPGKTGGAAAGGAVCNTGSVTLVNCTLAGNAAAAGSGGGGGGTNGYNGTGPPGAAGGAGGNGTGGAIENLNTANGACTLNSCTVSGNSVSAGSGGTGGTGSTAGANGANGQALGGGTHAVSGLAFYYTIVALNNAASGGPDVYGGFGSGNFNLIGKTDGSSGTWKSEDQTGSILAPLPPALGPLQDNGGPTPTMALLEGSPAIDKANSAASGAPHTDQRGFKRPVNFSDTYYPNASGGNGADIGAFEVQPPALTETRTGTKVVVTWPSPSTGFVLQQNGTITNTNGWSNFGGTVSSNSTTMSITNTTPTGNLFYRLKQ